MAEHPQKTSHDFSIQGCFHPPHLQVPTSEAKKGLWKGKKTRPVLLCLFLLSLALTVLGVYYFRKPAPPKIYTLQQTFFGNGEEQKVLMKIDPLARTEIFRTGEGSEEVLEIHDFKNGITGIFFTGDPKCFIRSQIKGIPETSTMELEETEGEEMTTTYYEQSVVWVPAEKPIENKDFLKNSKIFDLCKNVTVYWISPTLLRETEALDFEEGGELEHPASVNAQPANEVKSGHRRQARQLTEEDLPVNDYSENGLVFHPLWDERGYCCARCRRAHHYCRRVCEPLLGYYPYPYCYQGGRVICRVIMPCNWWIARMLGRV